MRLLVAGLVSLCLASASEAREPRGIRALEPVADGCGGWTATVRANGKGTLALLVDGQQAAAWDIRGDETREVSGTSAPGATVLFTATLSKSGDVERPLTLPPLEAKLRVDPIEGLVVAEGAEPRFDLALDTACDRAGIGWEATVRQTGVVKSGSFMPDGRAWVVVPGTQAGTYDVDVRLTGAGEGLPPTSAAYTVVAR